LLKVSGEALMGEQDFGIDPNMVTQVCTDVVEGITAGAEVALVVGGGNIFRGVALAAKGADRVSGDHMGMLATVMNAIALRMELENQGQKAVVLSAIAMDEVVEPFTQRAALKYLADGTVVIFAGGTGNPFFTTDTAAALRACEIGADALMKATQVDGIYSADPQKDASATRYDKITHAEILKQGLQVMDTAAVALTQESNLPILVFSLHEKGAFAQVLSGQGRFTLVSDS